MSVNQLFFWNKHLALSAEPLAKANLPTGTLLCVLPKTCTSNLPDRQVCNTRRDKQAYVCASWSKYLDCLMLLREQMSDVVVSVCVHVCAYLCVIRLQKCT